jgi:hypothetical protein
VDVRAAARQLLIRVGAHLSPQRMHDVSCMHAALALGRFVAEQTPGGKTRVRANKLDVYRDAIALAGGAQKPLYVEFGVWEGWSLRWWLEHLGNPHARFIGFDSFDGLPERWRPDYPARTFDRSGAPPLVEDPRVSFEVGLFEKTLRTFEPPPYDQLIVNVDCTLYSSTATVLEWLEAIVRPGDLIYFDELPEYDHELRALLEHAQRIELRLRPISQARGYFWLFQYT